MRGQLYDLVISDIMMSGIDGYELARKVREVSPKMPILFMTAKDDFVSKQKGFEIGIDDYMVKPVNLEALYWSVQALLRRANIGEGQKLTMGCLVMDRADRAVAVDGRDVPVTVREFNILFKLLSFPKQTFSREQLLDELWELGSDSSLRAVDVGVSI